MAKQILTNDWAPLLEEEFDKPYYQSLRSFLKEEYKTKRIYPHMNDIFNALHFTPYDRVKVVILGQDPYHGPNQAHGLSFSVQPGVDVPPSLRNMYKELQEDLGCPVARHGYLKQWADEGVLLLNTVLTVRAGEAHSHKGKGWEQFTDRIIQLISDRDKPVVFLLWGRPAQSKKALIDGNRHVVIEAPHPSPLSASRGFFGSRPFSHANKALEAMGETPVRWCLDKQVEEADHE